MGNVVIIIIRIQTNILFCPGHSYVLVVIAKQLSRVKFEIIDRIYLNFKKNTFDILKSLQLGSNFLKIIRFYDN